MTIVGNTDEMFGGGLVKWGIIVVVVVLTASGLSIAASVGGTGPVGDANVEEPTASFTYSPSTPNPDDTITLDASGSSDNGSIVSYEWDTDGDGYYDDYDDAPSGQTTSFSKGSGGTYTVGLRVTDDQGNTDTVTKQITVENPAPTASFTYSPSTPNPDDTITLDASGSSDEDGEIVSYEWDTDGDGYYDDYDDASSGQTTSFSKGSGGTYTVRLRVTDNGGKTDTVTKQITVDNPTPVASFTYSPSTPNPDDTITLDASGSSDEDGEIVSYEWDTDGDGYYDDYDDASNGQTTSFSKGSGGTYTVRLRVTDNGGKTETLSKQITVENPAPTASFTYSPGTPNPDDTISLDASGSSDEDGEIVSYEWDTDGDGVYDDYDDASNGQTTSFSKGTGGTYTVSLRVTDNGGKERTTTKQITVENPAPTASFTYSPGTPNPDDTITLDASGSSDEDGEIVSYEWDTDGDGVYDDYDDASNGQTTRFSKGTGGTYTVGLRITDNGGKVNEVTKQITVKNPAPTANISVTARNGLSVELDASGSTDEDGEIVSYEWDTDGDGVYGDYDDADDGQTTTASFESEGTYEVSVRVTDNGGKTSTVTETVGVSEPPEGSIGMSPDPLGDEQEVRFVANFTDPDGQIASYTWSIDGETMRGREAVTSFRSPGTVSVSLVVVDDTGISTRVSREVDVKESPEVGVSASTRSVIDGESVVFNASSDSTIQYYEWDADQDGVFETRGQSLEYAFANGGSKTVTVRGRDTNGVTGTASVTVNVEEKKPKVEVSWQPTTPRAAQDIVFNVSDVEYASRDNLSVSWTFKDRDVSKSGTKVTYAFEESGKYVVEVRVEDSTGDVSTVEKVVSVEQSADFSLTAQRNSVKAGESVNLVFSTSNLLRDTQVDSKIQLQVPSGASVSGVQGGSLVGRAETGFITVAPGGEESLVVTLQMNEPGTYEISGEAVYYVGDQESEDRRSQSVGPVNVSVEAATTTASTSESSGSTPIFPTFGIGGLLLSVLGGAYLAVRGRRGS